MDDRMSFEDADAVCLSCGMAKSEWTHNRGRGHIRCGQTYCCPECPAGGGCKCAGWER